MSNKIRGISFERRFAKLLSCYGFWARLDKGTAQTCDIIAGRNNTIYLFECKVCKKDYFDTSRVEQNQSDSRERFKNCGNAQAWFAFLVDEKIYLSKEPIKKPTTGTEWGEWIDNICQQQCNNAD